MVEGSAGVYVSERDAVERQLPLGARPALRPLPLRRRRAEHAAELGRRDRRHLVAEDVADLRPLGQDRILRQRRLWLPQQRRARRDHQGRSGQRRPGRCGHAAGAQQGRRAGRAHRNHPERAVIAGAVVPEAGQRTGLRRRCGRHRSRATLAALWPRMVHPLAAQAVDVRRPGHGLQPRPLHWQRTRGQLHSRCARRRGLRRRRRRSRSGRGRAQCSCATSAPTR